jgi:hypothetical protein
MTAPIHTALAERDLLPARHYLDSGYPSVALLVDTRRRWGTELISPLLADKSHQAKAGAGYDRSRFTIDFDAEAVREPPTSVRSPTSGRLERRDGLADSGIRRQLTGGTAPNGGPKIDAWAGDGRSQQRT